MNPRRPQFDWRRLRPSGLRRWLVPAAFSLFAGGVVFWLSTQYFPYLSVNHDEGVYLQQAAMLLDRQVTIHTAFPDAFRPWFFVVDGNRMYPKYAPVPAAVFALGKLAGGFRLALFGVATATAALVYTLTRDAFDHRTGLLASVALLGSPLFLLTSATFLSYAPTTTLNLLFAVAYVRAVRTSNLAWGVLAGNAIGLAFFSRPYTAILFAVPFAVHGVLELWRDEFRRVAPRYAVVSTFGLVWVGVTLGYNWFVTGSPLLFPYQAFAPHDGLGFGHRELLGYVRQYTPALALRANAHLLWAFATRWTVAPPLGTLLAGLGLARFLWRDRPEWTTPGLSDAELRGILAGLFVSVVVGNVFFWGNLNILAELGDPNDGFISQFGPFYHFDLLLPLSAFAASGVILLASGVLSVVRDRFDTPGVESTRVRAVVVALLLVTTPVVAVAEQAALRPTLDEHASLAEKHERAYRPFEERDFENALVFLPTPYGGWLNHPFQPLRNEPSFDGDVVYAQNRGPTGDFALVDAYEDRRLYRYTYRGRWSPAPDAGVTPKLERLRVHEGKRVEIGTRVGIPDDATRATVRLEVDGEVATFDIPRPNDSVAVSWELSSEGVRITTPNRTRSFAIDRAENVSLAVVVFQSGGSTFTYRQDVSVLAEDGSVRVLWPPQTRLCRLTLDCGREGTYLPEKTTLDGVSLNSTVSTAGRVDAGAPVSPLSLSTPLSLARR
ncbi:ArnT family glycosyltransferase [Haladaptatus sp. NG-WS-4]